jgi:hypothetical protein
MFRINAGTSPALTFNASASIRLGDSPIVSESKEQTFTNKTLGENCSVPYTTLPIMASKTLIGNNNADSSTPAALTATDARNLLGLGTNDDPSFRGVTIKAPNSNPSNVGMQFGGTDIYAISDNANQAIGINAKGTGEIFLNSAVNTLRVTNNTTVSSLTVGYRSVDSGESYTVQARDFVILAKANTAIVLITLPVATGTGGRMLVIKCMGVYGCAVVPGSNNTIDGSSANYVLTSTQSVTLIQDNANWYII